ncbi:hypothetical protein [Paenibacillus polysaccharolyticus]|uniref:hypothetical protein n=1 Tax=Paenibacillus polysaccharolyticus TaxID=582692 RepID=UPI00280B8D48|nr:hypothetical protein [Paenibacillus polysaccharolyticus]
MLGRAVTEDHVMFKECIPVFRPNPNEQQPHFGKEEIREFYSYVLLDFELLEEWDYGNFKVMPTVRVDDLPGPYRAFIAPVKLPNWIHERHNSHFFTVGLSAVLSFATSRPVKYIRDDCYVTEGNILDVDFNELALKFPVLFAGTGAHETTISKETSSKYYQKVKETLDVLFNVPYGLYVSLIQSIRLVQLAHLTKRDDFSLSYYLLASAIENIAQKAITRDSVKDKHPLEKQWKILAESNEVIKELYKTYKESSGKNKYISKRFSKFILKYCPVDTWELLEHPDQNKVSYYDELNYGNNWRWLTQKKWFEKYPSDLTQDEIETILSDLYKHRSNFTHQGLSPPHSYPDGHNRFFEEEHSSKIDDKTGKYYHETLIIPNYRLVSFIAYNSIIEFGKSKRAFK